MAIAPHFGAVLKPQLGTVGGFNRPDAGPPFAQRSRHFGNVPAERTDSAHAGDGYAPHHYWLAAASADFASTSFSTPSHIWRTLRTLRTSSSGIEISNSFS